MKAWQNLKFDIGNNNKTLLNSSPIDEHGEGAYESSCR